MALVAYEYSSGDEAITDEEVECSSSKVTLTKPDEGTVRLLLPLVLAVLHAVICRVLLRRVSLPSCPKSR